MSRIADAILAKGTAYAEQNPMLNLMHGGQNGLLARIGQVGPDGKNYGEWISNHAYISKNVIPIVLDYPRFMDLMPNSQTWIATYKAILELHPLTITGLTSGLTVDTDEHPIGAGGEQQEEAVNVKRERSVLSYTYKDKAGKALTKFLDYLTRYSIMDPDTKRPLVSQYLSAGLSEVGGMYTPDFYTGTCIFIEPDTTQRVVNDAWLCTNMFFKSTGDRTGKRDIRAPGEIPDHTIESTSITMNNEAVIVLATQILSTLSIVNKIPDMDLVLPANTVAANLQSAATGFNQYN